MRVDAHQHFWRIDRGDYGWLTAEALPKLYRDFLPADLAPLLAQARIDKTMLVQAAQTSGETQFLLDLAAQTPFVGGVVGWTDFAASDAPVEIERLSRQPALKGLRPMLQDLSDADWILREVVQPALRATAACGLRFDALIKPPQLAAVRRMLDQHPDLAVVIDHGAKPLIADGLMEPWAGHVRAIARDSRAVCKVSGLVTEAAPGWTVETLRPYVDVLLEAFGPSRLMFGSDWPVLTNNGDYLGWFDAAETLTSGLNEAERGQVFGGTAAAFYGLEA
jgi:L-fuconolactonase